MTKEEYKSDEWLTVSGLHSHNGEITVCIGSICILIMAIVYLVTKFLPSNILVLANIGILQNFSFLLMSKNII